MASSSDSNCRTKEFFANLKCPECFSAKVVPCDTEHEHEDKAACESCGCNFELGPGIPTGGMDQQYLPLIKGEFASKFEY